MTTTESKKSLEDKAEDVCARVADSLESAAESVRAAADSSASTINDLASQAGKKLDSTASCVRGIGGRKMLAGLRGKVNRHPLKSLAIATAVGVVAGFSCRSSR